MTRGRRPIPETPEGYLARDRAVFKLGRAGRGLFCPCGTCDGACYPVTAGEFLHRADMEGC